MDFEVPFAGDFPVLRTNENNGVLRFYEINPLKSSGSSSSVYINVYVYSGDDFVLYRPEVREAVPYTFLPVGAVEGPSDIDEVEPVAATSTGNDVVDIMPGREKIYFGEVISSIKQLCNRECLNYKGLVTVTHAFSRYNLPPFPFLPAGPSQMAVPPALSVGFTFQAYFAPCFLAMRGGQRFKVVTRAVLQAVPFMPYSPAESIVSAYSIDNRSETAYWFQDIPFLPDGGPTLATLKDLGNMASGTALESTWIHPALEIEMPYTTPCRFVNPRKTISLYEAKVRSLTPTVVPATTSYDTESGTYRSVEVWTSAADDFSLHGFMFIPIAGVS